MPFLEQLYIDNGLLLIWDMTENQEQLAIFAQEFAEDPNFKKITHAKRQQEWLSVRKLLQFASCDNVQITYNENGKPCIDHPKYKSISISHSAKFAGIFLHAGEMIGLDIESLERDFSKIEQKYLRPEESVLACQFNNGLAWFWCIKEAAYKAADIPGLIFNKEIVIKPEDDGSLEVTVQRNKTLKFKIHQEQRSNQLMACLTLQQE